MVGYSFLHREKREINEDRERGIATFVGKFWSAEPWFRFRENFESSIANVEQLWNNNNWPYSLADNNHTFVYAPTDITDSKDVYARAFFVTLQ